MLDRRAVVRGGLAGVVFSLAPRLAAAAAPEAVTAACLRDAAGNHAVALLDKTGAVLTRIPLPGRGHGIAVAPDGRTAVAFARRPGRFALAVDTVRALATSAFTAGPGRHFYGHGAFSPDGRLLYAPENDYANAAGVLGVYDAAAGFVRVDERPGGGIGPHEAVRLDDGTTLAVAVGGIATHPDSGRAKLNVPAMEPALAYLDRRSGALLERATLPAAWHRLSLRHLAVDASGTVWLGGQYEGPATDRLPLVWRHRRGGDLTPADGADTLWAAMRQYVGSVAVSADGRYVVATSPRGGVAAVWETATGRPVGRMAIADVCGAAAAVDGGLLLSDGTGRLWHGDVALARATGIAWDNHMAAIRPAG